jgi:hypothetical protein
MDAQVRERLRQELSRSKLEVTLRGHMWDVADVIEVVEDVITQEG